MGKVKNGIDGEIIIKPEQREVAIRNPDKSERLGIFHKWTYDSSSCNDFALVENTDGIMEYVPYYSIRFMPVEFEPPLKEKEKMYMQIGLMEGGR